LLQGNEQRRREADDGAHLFAQVAEMHLARSLKSNVWDALRPLCGFRETYG